MSISKKIGIAFEIIMGMPKSLFICFKYLPINQAVKLPILVSYYCKCVELHGEIKIEADNIRPGMILLGIGPVGFIHKRIIPGMLELGKNSVTKFKGKVRLGNGAKISTNGFLEFGENFVITGDSLILCKKHILFGKDNLISWHVEIMDTDGHGIYHQGKCINGDKEIVFGDKVWVASGCKILKGVTIHKGNIIAANTLVTRSTTNEDSIFAGNPAKLIKQGIKWEM